MTKSVLSRPSIPDTQTPGNSHWHVLAATWLGELFDGMDASIYVITMYPALCELLSTHSHAEIAPTGAVITCVFILGWTAGGIVFGTLSDYIGRSRTMMFTVLLYALCSGLCALSHNWQELALYRFLVGFGIGGEIGIGAVMVSECWRGRPRLHAAGFLASSFASGCLLAAAFNFILGGFGWRWLYLVGVLPALVTVYLRTHVRESDEFMNARAHKSLLLQRNLATLSREEQAKRSFTLRRIFEPHCLKKTLAVVGLATPAVVGYWAVLSWIPSWINQLVGGEAIGERSLATFALNAGAVCSTLAAGALVIKLGRQRCFQIANIGALVFCFLLFGTARHFDAYFLCVAYCLGAFASMPFALLFIYVPELFETAIRGTAFGFSVTAGRIFAAAAAIAGGQLIAFFGGSYPIAGMTIGLVYVLGITVSFVMPASPLGEKEEPV